jgi:hypothetical protein
MSNGEKKHVGRFLATSKMTTIKEGNISRNLQTSRGAVPPEVFSLEGDHQTLVKRIIFGC